MSRHTPDPRHAYREAERKREEALAEVHPWPGPHHFRPPIVELSLLDVERAVRAAEAKHAELGKRPIGTIGPSLRLYVHADCDALPPGWRGTIPAHVGVCAARGSRGASGDVVDPGDHVLLGPVGIRYSAEGPYRLEGFSAPAEAAYVDARHLPTREALVRFLLQAEGLAPVGWRQPELVYDGHSNVWVLTGGWREVAYTPDDFRRYLGLADVSPGSSGADVVHLAWAVHLARAGGGRTEAS